MARPTIENIRGIGDFATLYRWNLTFITLPPAVADFNKEDLNFRCESFTLPKLTGSTIDVSIRGLKVRQPGIYDYERDITLTFAATVDGKIHNFFRKWREAIWVTGEGRSAFSKAQLQADINLTQLNNEDKPFWEFILVGCFLQSFDFATMTSAESDIQKPTLVLNYDYFKDGPVTG